MAHATADENEPMTSVLGIDIGGTGIKGAPVDTGSGQLLADRHRILTPHPATPDAVTEVVAGRIDFSPQLPATTLPLIDDGKLIALAVSAEKRIKTLPNVPTVLEAGLPVDAIYPFYSGLFLPAKTPHSIVERLHQETAKAMQTPEVQARFAKLGVEPMTMTLEQFAAFFKKDVAEALALVKAANIPRQ